MTMWDFNNFENTALIENNGKTLTYEQLIAECEKLSHATGSRCLIFILCENTIASIVGYVCAIQNRIVPALLSAHMERGLLDGLLEKYKPSFLWMPKNLAAGFEGFDSVYETYGYSLLRTGYDLAFPLYDGLALLLTTSGSTGSPKFVRQSYENIKANTASIVEYLALTSSERAITTLPMNYTYGLSIINTHLSVGATLLVTKATLMQKEFWSFLKSYRATSIAGVPYTYEMLEKLRFFRMDLPYLKTMTQAGGKLTSELHEKFASYAAVQGKKFIVMYGQCEATARMGYLPADQAGEKKGSMGIAIPGGKLRLLDVKGHEITSPFTTGELVYEGANVTLGYAEKGEDLILGDERHGVLETGDMAQFDEDGFFYIVGRKKRFLKIYGNRVNLDEVDRMIKGHFEGIECASSGMDDHLYIFIVDPADRGKNGRLDIYTAGENVNGQIHDINYLADSIKSYVSQMTKLNPAAFKTVVVDEIPKNDSGKTLYKQLEKYYDK